MPNPSTLWSRKVVVGSDPAANTEWTHTVPPGKAWELVAVTVVLAQGATDTPQPILVLDDGSNVIAEIFGAAAAQAVSTTQRYTWARELPMAVAGTGANIRSTAPLPDGLFLAAGGRVRSSTIGLGANSNYGAPNVTVIEYSL